MPVHICGCFKEIPKGSSTISGIRKSLMRRTNPYSRLVLDVGLIAAGLINPNEYAIYDSRAVYSLNWLLFNFVDETELYPQPSGRNPKLSQFDLSTIFNLTGRGVTYISHKTAYFEYCDLLKSLSKEVYGNDKPYKIEMLLFLIAPTKIIECIEKKTIIMINI